MERVMDDAVNCVAAIAVKWDANEKPLDFLLDRDDAALVGEALREAGLLKAEA